MYFAKDGTAFRTLQRVIEAGKHFVFETFHIYLDNVRNREPAGLDQGIPLNNLDRHPGGSYS